MFLDYLSICLSGKESTTKSEVFKDFELQIDITIINGKEILVVYYRDFYSAPYFTELMDSSLLIVDKI